MDSVVLVVSCISIQWTRFWPLLYIKTSKSQISIALNCKIMRVYQQIFFAVSVGSKSITLLVMQKVKGNATGNQPISNQNTYQCLKVCKKPLKIEDTSACVYNVSLSKKERDDSIQWTVAIQWTFCRRRTKSIKSGHHCTSIVIV